jgi:hypothetical protein
MDSFGDEPKYPAMLVISADNSPNNVGKLEERLRKHFTSVSQLLITDFMVKRKWPQPQNNAFKRTAQHFVWTKPKLADAFFWIEADCMPLKKGWADTLVKEYAESGKLWMGVKKSIPATKPGHLPREYMNGVGFYPFNAMHKAPGIVLAYDAPWDFVIGDIVAPEMHVSSKMAAHYRATEFTGTIDKLKFKQTDWNKDGTVAAVHDREISLKDAVFFHGCKDASLAKIILGETKPQKKKSLGAVLKQP